MSNVVPLSSAVFLILVAAHICVEVEELTYGRKYLPYDCCVYNGQPIIVNATTTTTVTTINRVNNNIKALQICINATMTDTLPARISISNMRILLGLIPHQSHTKQLKTIHSLHSPSLFSCIVEAFGSIRSTLFISQYVYCIPLKIKERIKIPHFIQVKPSRKNRRK